MGRILPSGTSTFHSSARSAAMAMSASVRSLPNGSFTVISTATAFTPCTRCTARSAAYFSAWLERWPVRVTTPSLTITPMSDALKAGSQLSSAWTSSRNWVSVFMGIPCGQRLESRRVALSSKRPCNPL